MAGSWIGQCFSLLGQIFGRLLRHGDALDSSKASDTGQEREVDLDEPKLCIFTSPSAAPL